MSSPDQPRPRDNSSAALPASPHAKSAPGRLRSPQKAPDGGFVAVGRILGPFGLKGEVKVQSLTDNAARFEHASQLFAGHQALTVATSREAGGFYYLTFKGHGDRTSVDPLRHRLLQVRETDLPPLPEGEYYRFQLVGLTAVDTAGTTLGLVVEIIETGANDVLRIESTDKKELLVPLLADAVLSVDLAAKRIVLDPPDWR